MRTATVKHLDAIPPSFLEDENVLVQIFTLESDPKRISGLIASVRERMPRAKIIGMTTAGNIDEGELHFEGTLYVVSSFEQTRIHTRLVSEVSDLRDDTVGLIHGLIGQESELPPRAAILFADGLSVDGAAVMETVQSINPDIAVAGGLAGDNRRFKQTFVFTEAGISNCGIAAAMLFSDVLVTHSHYAFNWLGLGKKFTVTRAVGNRVYTLDDTPVIDIYKKYLGDEITEQLPDIGLEFPLIISHKDSHPVARAVMTKFDDGSLGFAGSIREGEKVQFGFGDIESMTALHNERDQELCDKPIESIFIYSCIARYTLMGDDVALESLRYQRIAPTSGCFTYGEFFHNSESGSNTFLNQTMTIFALSEDVHCLHRPEALLDYDMRKSVRSKALSHFVHTITKELEASIEMEKRSKEIMLHQSRQASIGETIEMIAHQWRQPLNIIALTLQDIYINARLGNLRPDTLDANYEKANKSIQYLSQTIDDFRNFMKPTKSSEEFTLQDLFTEKEQLISGLVKKYHINYRTFIDSNIVMQGRKNELLQCLLNLIHNAVDAINEKNMTNGIITVSASVEPGNLVLTVQDNAGGIPKQHIAHIFDPYYTTKNSQNGTGLGLYIAKIIIEKYMHGILSADNCNNGACFTIKIPHTSN
jgi:signal transduction histidine kinase